MTKKWYEEPVIIILFLLFIWPVGLFMMWKYSNWGKGVKVAITALLVAIIVLGGLLWFTMVALVVREAKKTNTELDNRTEQVLPDEVLPITQPSEDTPSNFVIDPNVNYRETFVNGCVSEGGQDAFCTCTYDYFIENYSLEELYNVGVEYNQTGKYPESMLKTLQYCIVYIE